CCGVAASAGSASPTMGIQQAPSGISFLLDIVLLSVRREPDSLDHALARHPRSLARLLDGCGRRRLEHAKHELVSGQVQRASKNRARTHAALIGGSADRDAKLRLRHAGPEALGRVEHGREPPQWLSQRCPKPIPRPWQRGRRARDSDEAKMGSPRVEFRILGPLAVHVDGTPVPAGGPKQRALLALLLLSANRVVSRERLIGEVFPEQSVSSADHALRNHVSRLRKVLSPSATGEARLVARPPGYLLRVEPGELDLENFERLAVEGREVLAAGDATAAAASLRAAEALWQGRPLGDLEFEGLARIEAERLEELRLAAVEARVDAELELGRHLALVPEL